MPSKSRLKKLRGLRHPRRAHRAEEPGDRRQVQILFVAIVALVLMTLLSAEAHAEELVRPAMADATPPSSPTVQPTSMPGSDSPPAEPLSPDTRLPPRRKVRRTREDIRRERQALLERTRREIDEIIAEFHAQLPRERAQVIGALYARYSSRFQDSIADQVRALFEEAVRQGIFIPRDNVFFDLAISGSKSRRPGLDAVRAAIQQNQFRVFLVFTTSRLFRKAYRAMQFVEELLVERGIRAIFVRSGLDTSNQEHWRLMFSLLSSMDEAQVSMYSEHIRASHEGLFIRQCVWGTLSLGYTGEEVAGEFTRRQRPRRKIVIDESAADWIRKIFEWYVAEGLSRDDIARELNDDPHAPVPPKNLTGLWTAKLVRDHLMNPCYRGWWCYGAKKSRWLTQQDYCGRFLREQPLRAAQFEDLRVIQDAQWYEAQRLLAEEQAKSGRRSRDGDRQSRPRLLRGLFFCPDHGRQLVAGGPGGKILFCPLCRAIKSEKRPLYSHLNRKLALERTCETLAELVRADERLMADIITACQQAAAQAQQPDPEVLRRLRAQSNRLSRTIDFNRRNPGETEEEHRQAEMVLRDLRRQLQDVSVELAAHEAAAGQEIVIPPLAEVQALLDELAGILTAAASAETDEPMTMARRIINELTGGRIELFQMGERKAQRGWLQGRFQMNLVEVVFGRLTGVSVPIDNPAPMEITIDYRRAFLIDEQMEEAKRLWDQGLLCKSIARKMDRSKAYVTMLIQRWFSSRGLPCPDGRKRRAEVADKQVETPAYKEMADEVVVLVDQGWSNLAIARQLRSSDTTIGKAIAWWFQSRRLPVPTADERRRKSLLRAKDMLEAGRLLKDIAAELSYTPRGLKLGLKALYAELGEAMPDGRRLRWNPGESTPE